MAMRRLWAIALASAVGLAVLVSMPAVSSASTATGSVSGVVRASGQKGGPLRGICVNAELNGAAIKSADTKAGGRYKLGGLDAGTYTIVFNPAHCGNNRGFLPLTRKVKVRAGQAVTGFNASLKTGASISGKVTGPGGGPVAGICAMLTDAGDSAPVEGVATSSEGTYTINALPAGTYSVQFVGGLCGNAGSYAPQYYRDQANQGSASRFALAAGQAVKGIDAVMRPGATITGAVTDSTGQSTDGTCVDVYPVSDARLIPDTYQGYQVYPSKGKYTLANLAPGLYLVEFGCYVGGPPSGLAGQWGAGRATAATADLISAPGGAVTTVNASLSKAGSITGRVTDQAGHPFAGACVVAIPHGSAYPFLAGPYPTLHTDPNDMRANLLIGSPGPALTGASGRYSIGGLLPGSYDVQFSDCGQRTQGAEWYKNALTEQSGTTVQVKAGATASGTNAVLSPGGSISGRVTNGAGHTERGVCVTASDASGQFFGSALTGQGGRYTITGLATGSYQVSTFLPSCEQVEPVAGAGTSAPVTITAPDAIAGVSLTVRPTGSVTGTVTNASGHPLDGVCVLAVPDGQGGPGLALSGYSSDLVTLADRAGGSYQVNGLAPGRYQLTFDDPACLEQELTQDDSYAPAASAQVTITAGGLAKGINARLLRRGQITGTVTGPGDSPVAGECVRAVPAGPAADPYFGTTGAARDVLAVTRQDGTYSLIDLPPGGYRVEFSSAGCGAAGFATQWWQDASNQASATVVTVSAGATASGIDAGLSSG